jgi:tetratricopeptide (TPR) repeat protein
LASAELVMCPHCGSPVSKRRLERHVERVHRKGSPKSGSNARLQPPLPRNLISRAVEISQQSPAAGLRYLKNLEAKYAPDPDVHCNMGVAFMHLDRFEEARVCFEKALALDKGHEYARSNLNFAVRAARLLSKTPSEADLDEMGTVANVARESGFFELALKVGEMMLGIAKDKYGSLNDLALTYQHQKKLDKALEYYDMALSMKPDMFEAVANKGLCLLMMNRVEESFALHCRAVEMKPDYLQGWYHLGCIEISRGRTEESVRYLDRALELNDEYYLAWLAKSEVLRKMGRGDEAESCLNRAMKLNPEYAAQAIFGRRGKRKGSWTARAHTSGMHAKRVEASGGVKLSDVER